MADIPEGEIYKAIVAYEGNLAKVATDFEISRTKLQSIVDASLILTTLMGDYKLNILDQAENVIFNDVKRGDSNAARFLLTTLGKDRGYSTKVETDKTPVEVVIRDIRAELSYSPPSDGSSTP